MWVEMEIMLGFDSYWCIGFRLCEDVMFWKEVMVVIENGFDSFGIGVSSFYWLGWDLFDIGTNIIWIWSFFVTNGTELVLFFRLWRTGTVWFWNRYYWILTGSILIYLIEMWKLNKGRNWKMWYRKQENNQHMIFNKIEIHYCIGTLIS